jgi:hypothetical protein
MALQEPISLMKAPQPAKKWKYGPGFGAYLTFVHVMFEKRTPDRRPAMIYCVALPFTPADSGLAPGQAVECQSESAAIRRAHLMSCDNTNVGAVAFSRRGDPNLGEFEDAVVLKTFGQVPDDFPQSQTA